MVRGYFNHLWREMSATGRQTFPWDLTRGAAAGALGTVQATFALAVAIEYSQVSPDFNATMVHKSIIGGAHAIGLLLSLVYATWPVAPRRKTLRAALPMSGVALGLFLAAIAKSAHLYTAGTALAGICLTLPLPTMTGIYRDNYRGHVRGQVIGLTVILSAVVALVAQFGGGALLSGAGGASHPVENYRLLYLIFAVVALVSGAAVLRIPSRMDLPGQVSPNPLKSFGAIRENPAFGVVLLAWFLFGFANLSLMPQRLEYLAGEQYGIALTAGQIAIVIGVTDSVVRLSVTQVWARLFDHVNFVKLRMVLSGLILVSILIYYHTTSLPLIILAQALLSMSHGGGAIAWSLWVTKFSPPHETARYMSVHTFFTGVRGSMAPLVGYLVVEHLSIHTAAWISCGLIALSLPLLWSIRHQALRADGE